MLDSFQIIIGIYLLVVAIRGSGQLYNFEVREECKDKLGRRLRIAYFALSCVAFLDGGVSTLQNTLFTRTVAEDGAQQIIRNAVAAPEWVTYPLLSWLINGLIALFVLIILLILLMLRKYRAPESKS